MKKYSKFLGSSEIRNQEYLSIVLPYSFYLLILITCDANKK